jgi:tetratricopeptide (TPR) repeat protein
MKHSLLLLTAAVAFVSCASPAVTSFTDGVRLYREGHFAAARDAFDTAVRRSPQDPAAWNNRGVSRVRLGDLDGAVADYTAAMQLSPADAEIVFNRGNAHAAAGNLQAAINDFTTAITLRPGYAQALFNRGAVRSAAGDSAGAVADWQMAIDMEPDPWTRAAMRRGSGLDYMAASPALGGVAVAMPPAGTPAGTPALDGSALVGRAMMRQVDGDRAGAVRDLRAALAAEPNAVRRARIETLLRSLEATP